MRKTILADVLLGLCGALVFAGSCRSSTEPGPVGAPYVRFVASLVAPSGLVQSRPGDDYTTTWKNALATMVLLHEGRVAPARGILDVFERYRQAQGAAFQGVPQPWSAAGGMPLDQGATSAADYYWVGDGAGLLLAVQYYRMTTGDDRRYGALETALEEWLAGRADDCATIVAEGDANMYAALSAYRQDPAIAPRLVHLKQCFYTGAQFDQVADHTVRAALVFGDPSGFAHLGPLVRSESWCADARFQVQAYAAFAGEPYVNLDISTELLLAWKLWRQQSGADLSSLERQITRLELAAAPDPQARGLPYLVTAHQFAHACDAPIVDTTAFMLFALWEWNPFSLSGKPAVL